MKALYLYFTGTATQGRGASSPAGERPPAADPRILDEGPLVPIQPGAFSRWMANRDRVIAENTAALRAGVTSQRSRHTPASEATG